MFRRLDSSSTTCMAKIMGKFWRTRGTWWTKLVRSSVSWIAMWNTISGSSFRTLIGEKTELGMFVRSSERGMMSVSICGWHSNGWKEAEYGFLVEEIDEKKTYERTSLLDHVDVLSVNAKHVKPFSNIIRTCSSHVFLLEEQKNYLDGRNLTHKRKRGPTTWMDTPKNAFNDTVNWKTSVSRQLVSKLLTILQLIPIPPFELTVVQTRMRHFVRFSTSLYWTIWHLVVCEQACKISHKNGLKHVTHD